MSDIYPTRTQKVSCTSKTAVESDQMMTPHTTSHTNWAEPVWTDTHVHLVAVEEVDVGLVLVIVLTHQQQH